MILGFSCAKIIKADDRAIDIINQIIADLLKLFILFIILKNSGVLAGIPVKLLLLESPSQAE